MGKFRIAILLLLLTTGFGVALASGAEAARYTVAQCGWHVGHDAGWVETSANKFVRSSYCQTPASADPFDGVHLNSQTRNSTDTISGTRFARWRWQAPAGTGIVTVHGQRWHSLFEGFQHRIGSVAANGNFAPFLQYSTTDTVKRDFSGAFSPFAQAFETRLLCAKAESQFCTVRANSLAGVRALTITIDDSNRPSIAIGGALSNGFWLRETQGLNYSATDLGSGLRYSQTLVDGSVKAQTEHQCSKELIAGQWRGTRMQPCGTSASGSHTLSTLAFSDGPHQLRQCAVDFAGNSGCLADRTIYIDNTPPGTPRNLTVAGSDGWRRTNGFRVEWQNPDQGAASPIHAFVHQTRGAGGYDTGPVHGSGPGPVPSVVVPASGEYRVSVWLIDLAGNTNPASAAEVTLRFDDVPPVAWFDEPPEDRPEYLKVPVSDAHSGVSGGVISYRRQGTSDWNRLATEFRRDIESKTLEAVFPSDDVPAGIYEFQAVVLDHAGNTTVTGNRANGSPLTMRAPRKETTALVAKLAHKGRSGLTLSVPFAEVASLTGRLTGPGGVGMAGRDVEVTQTPGPGSQAGPSVLVATTGDQGYFEASLGEGAGRRVSVRFAGNQRFTDASAGPLHLKVKGAVRLSATPRKLKTGERLKFRGNVRTDWAYRPGRGNLVAIQYFETASRKWRPVLVARTGRLGRFSAGYRFRYITRSARIRLRAVLLPSQNFPYEPAASKPVRVKVKGVTKRRPGR